MENEHMNKKGLWYSLFYGTESDGTVKDQAYVINVYSLIAFLSTLAFGILHLAVEGNPLVGALEIGCSSIILLNSAIFRLIGKVTLARTVLLLTIMALMMILLISGGTAGTGIFWLFVFPLVTFFMVGKSQGLWWMTSLYVLIALVTLGAHLSLFEIPYPLITIRQLLISLTIVTVGVYIYQEARESALRKVEDSQRDLQEYLDKMPTYNIKVGIDGRIIFANKEAKESSGLGEQMLGTKFLDSLAWKSNEEARKRAEVAFYEAVTGKTVTYDEQIKVYSTKGLKVLTVNFSLVPIFKDERIAYILVEARDVTTEREADRTKAEFTVVATQQLQPAVASIADAAARLRRSLPERLTDDQHRDFQQITRHTQHIRASISNMMLVSGLELGNLPVSPQNLNIGALCQSVVEAIRIVHLKDRMLEISEDYAKNLPEVAVDFELMRTVLHNLILNAIKFTPDTGHINIRISQTEQKLAPDSKGSLQIEVQDNGRGIPDDEQKLIFTKFFHAQNASDQAAGSGQGLYITKKLLDYVGGSISFTSKEKVGTIFIILLPLEGMAPRNQSKT